jgi:hypothetical protein
MHHLDDPPIDKLESPCCKEKMRRRIAVMVEGNLPHFECLGCGVIYSWAKMIGLVPCENPENHVVGHVRKPLETPKQARP